MTKLEERFQIVTTLLQNGHDPSEVVYTADTIMKHMYGEDWINCANGCGCKRIETFNPIIAEQMHGCKNFERVPIVSIAEQDGEKGVRLCVGDIDIFIEAHDLDEDGKEFTWYEAIKKLKDYGKRTFDKHEMHLIAAFKDEINAALRKIGGAELDNYYWSSTECNSLNVWLVNFISGYIYNYFKYYTLVVRPVANFKPIQR